MPASTHWPAAPLVEEIAELLRERIVDGRAAPGVALSQRRLADELGVGRGVVAEALRVLRREGLIVVAPPGRGVRVAGEEDRSSLLSAYAVREVIDGLAARLASVSMGPALAPLLRAAIDDQRDAAATVERGRYARANSAFHGGLISACGNRFLLGHMALVHSTSRAASLLHPARLRDAVDEHESILRAVCDRDADAAEAAARAHVRATVAALP